MDAPASTTTDIPSARFGQAIFPVLTLALLVVYGLIVRPQLLGQPAFPLEVIFILASCAAVAHLVLMGHRWADMERTIVSKFNFAMPAFFILLSIGLVIGSWIICGTIPMLVYWGLKIIDPRYLYALCFVLPAIFSTLTGTSWGSAGTIGVVLMGIATALDANLGIAAGAIIGGSFFGDKLSPLSDTTSLAALAAEVDLYAHVRSMLWTTVPSALIALGIFWWMGFVHPPKMQGGELAQLEPFLAKLKELFHFSPLLLAPPLIVLYGSVRQLPTVPVLLASVLVACLLTLVMQRFSVSDVAMTLHKGFDCRMASWVKDVPPEITKLLNRGGLYALSEAVIIAFTVFVFIGTMDHIKAMPTVVNRLVGSVQSQPGTVVATLAATGITNAMTSNQYATSFIIGDAFKPKFDALRIPRSVLSRSLEDTGTMIESIIPWHASTVYMVATLGVPYAEYWHWQLLTWINIPVAILLALTGIGCRYGR